MMITASLFAAQVWPRAKGTIARTCGKEQGFDHSRGPGMQMKNIVAAKTT